MTNPNQTPKPIGNGGFSTREAQLANTGFRGMEPDATLEEVNIYDQTERDIVNAEHFGYPIGTPAREIGHDLTMGNKPESE